MIGEEVERSPVQVILKWALQSGMVCELICEMATVSASAISHSQPQLSLGEIDNEGMLHLDGNHGLQAVIPQSSKKLHIQSNLELDDFTLTSEQLLKIDARDGALS